MLAKVLFCPIRSTLDGAWDTVKLDFIPGGPQSEKKKQGRVHKKRPAWRPRTAAKEAGFRLAFSSLIGQEPSPDVGGPGLHRNPFDWPPWRAQRRPSFLLPSFDDEQPFGDRDPQAACPKGAGFYVHEQTAADTAEQNRTKEKYDPSFGFCLSLNKPSPFRQEAKTATVQQTDNSSL
jgi:hypothetical protein